MYIASKDKIEKITTIGKNNEGIYINTEDGGKFMYPAENNAALMLYHEIGKMIQDNVGLIAHEGIIKTLKDIENEELPEMPISD